MRGEDDVVVMECIGLLCDLIEDSAGMMSPRQISYALYGLQGTQTLTEEVRATLRVLTDKMRQSQGKWSATDIGFSIAGLSGLQVRS